MQVVSELGLLLPFASRIKIQVKAKLRERFQGEGQENSVFFLAAGVITHDRTEGSDPVRQIAVDRVSLFLEESDCALVLFLKSKSPVVIESLITSNNKKAAVVEERIVVEITVSKIKLKIRKRLNGESSVDLGKPFVR